VGMFLEGAGSGSSGGQEAAGLVPQTRPE